MNRYKLIVFDLDDTLLDKQKHIDDSVLESILRMKKNGYIISSISGRNCSMMSLYNKQMQIESFAACNGSLVYINNSIIYSSPISETTVRKLFSLCYRYDMVFCLFGKYDGYYCRNVPCLSNALNYNKLVQNHARAISLKYDNEYVNSNVYKFMVYIDEQKCDIERFTKEVTDIGGLCITIADKYFEITNDDSRKEFALEKISKTTGVNRKEIVYFGDSLSDLGALEYSGYSVCMNSSVKELKAVADDIAKDNKDINRILLNIEKGLV